MTDPTPGYYLGTCGLNDDLQMQPFDVIDAYELDFYLGNVIKYVCRAGRKGNALEDLTKARHYIDEAIKRRGGIPAGTVTSADIAANSIIDSVPCNGAGVQGITQVIYACTACGETFTALQSDPEPDEDISYCWACLESITGDTSHGQTADDPWTPDLVRAARRAKRRWGLKDGR